MTGSQTTSDGRTSNRMTVYDEVRQRIITGQLGPGAIVSENEIAVSMGLSRQPVREALLLLANERMVEVRPQSGTYVSLIDPDFVRQAQFIREALELTSLPIAIEKLTEEDEQELQEIVAGQADLGRHTPDDYYPFDERIHFNLLKIAGYETAWTAISAAMGHLDRIRFFAAATGLRVRENVADEHRKIVDAAIARDTEAARAELREHLRAVLADLDAMQATHPDFFEVDRLSNFRHGRTPRANLGRG